VSLSRSLAKMAYLHIQLFLLHLTMLWSTSSSLSFPINPNTNINNSNNNRFYYLVTGGNKGQGYALCERILEEHKNSHVFLCSRDPHKGDLAAKRLGYPNRVDMIPLDVTKAESIAMAVKLVQERLIAYCDGDTSGGALLEGLVSNAGILWGYTVEELLDVCTEGVANVIDAFLPLLQPDGGKIIIVSSGLGPLLHSYSTHQHTLRNGSWNNDIRPLIHQVRSLSGQGPKAFETIGFPGGPFAETAPDFHMYGLAKMFADCYMVHLARANPDLVVNSCDPGLVYTDLIDRMPRYSGKSIEKTNGAKLPREGVEVTMRLLFEGTEQVRSSGGFFAVNGDGELKSGPIDKRPDV